MFIGAFGSSVSSLRRSDMLFHCGANENPSLRVKSCCYLVIARY